MKGRFNVYFYVENNCYIKMRPVVGFVFGTSYLGTRKGFVDVFGKESEKLLQTLKESNYKQTLYILADDLFKLEISQKIKDEAETSESMKKYLDRVILRWEKFKKVAKRDIKTKVQNKSITRILNDTQF